MKKYLLMLLSAMFALATFTNCGDDNDEENGGASNDLTGDWKITAMSLDFGEGMAINYPESQVGEQYARYDNGYLYAAVLEDGAWRASRTKCNYSNGQLVDKNGIAIDVKIEGETFSMNLMDFLKVTYKKATMPAEAQKLIDEKNYTEIDGFGEMYDVEDEE